ncbi:MAG: 30S ribosomal protein S12 methylthiotransferase RimO [Lachnospiraceae bacterium]|nr:30S ribosomal protein S12 methylthiotransferase RimO [Lachnospiraceae bacterium]SDW03011.1 SSU ribosomal protein S12P methylthiotransferase [Lachnospiraceae bacterium KHCPX20]
MMKLYFVSLGCDKNLVDAEHMLSLLSADGYEITEDEAEADVIVVNSCCFISDAAEESVNTIIDLARYKTEGHLKALIVTGCLSQRFTEEMKVEIPEVDGIIGTSSYDEITAVLRRVLKGEKQVTAVSDLARIPEDKGRIVTTGGHYAYLKIAEGCDKNCSYCIIPKIRGPYRSIPMERILDEAKKLVADGVRELILVAQETTIYGSDLYGKKSLPLLLKKLGELKGLAWIRILYAYPEEIDDELIEEIATNPKVCHYIDMPIQHANDYILGRMGRRTNQQDIIHVVKKLRERIPDMCIRTTLICGFPGETEQMHQEQISFMKEMEFDRLGSFPFSPEDGTVAFEMPDQVPDVTKNIWYDEIMRVQQEITFRKNESLVGKEFEVFIEGEIPKDRVYVGRTYRDAPGVDGLVFMDRDIQRMSGDLVRVKITKTHEYDLIGEIIDENESTE